MAPQKIAFAAIAVALAVLAYHFYDKAQLESQHKFQITQIQKQIEGQLPEGLTLENWGYINTGRQLLIKQIQDSLKKAQEAGTIEEWSLSFEVDEDVYKLIVE